jgi:DNA-binding response OmpR family regulator
MESPTRTLIVDDEKDIRYFLRDVLAGEGHDVVTVGSGEEALAVLRERDFDLTFLDLRLGGRIDGLRILEAISWRWPGTARVILTGHGSLETAMSAIRDGVDAYLLKPVRANQVRQVAEEVLAKRRAIAAPPQSPEAPSILRRGSLEVDLQRRMALREDSALELNAGEYELLVHLMQNDDRPVGAAELVKVVRGYDCDHVHEARDIIKWYIYSLRQKVERDPSAPRHILNVRGVGYIFKA